MHEEFRVAKQPLVDREEMKVRPGNVLVAIRDPRNLYYLKELLQTTDMAKQDVVVMTAAYTTAEPPSTASGSYDSKELFDEYEQQLFTKVVELAEKEEARFLDGGADSQRLRRDCADRGTPGVFASRLRTLQQADQR